MSGKLTVQCLAWRPLPTPKGTLLGFASIRIAEVRLTLHDIALHRKNDAQWAQLPARPIAEFDGRDVRDAFSAAVIHAVRAYAPGVP